MLGSEMKKPTVGPVAGKRPKVALQPGRSLMDWIRLGASGQDLQGFNGATRTISMEELKKHNTKNDCWMLLRGKVYNITSYLEFHPGGIPELMRGAGQDGTALFDEVHKWVNIESMLGKCFIGPIEDNVVKKKKENNQSIAVLLKPTSKIFLDQTDNADNNKRMVPRYEWYQDETIVALVIYTKSKNITEDELLIDCADGETLDCKVLFKETFYRIHIALENTISALKVKSSTPASGKFEVVLEKSETGLKWNSLGEKLMGNGQLHESKDRELIKRQCTIDAIEQVTANTKLYAIKLPERVHYTVPIGHHVLVEADVQGIKIGKHYTVALESLDAEKRTKDSEKHSVYLNFMIKIYEDGALTPVLDKLKLGDSLSVSDCTGDFVLSRLQSAKSVFMIAAGTGLTPMIRIMDYIVCDKAIERKGHLLFANRHGADILWKDELDRIALKHSNRIQVQYILSRPSDDWIGLKGRIDKGVLENFLGSCERPSVEEELLICICGPDLFTVHMKKYLLEMGLTENTIHCFLG